ncbi:DUF4349 domain-containing protein [Sphingosinicella humi]|uniref:DUF4349 domain-containing protein n=1 Tax=Allosphingosinicella humi TaxID=2068657 RepID=A0A2U2J1I2_9SPHN|nr:DUF4349 domain-containing protein [Sphingosinicella humi]PWG02199.1 DUF4349 domain-containing protein [Sphingosinicella humi]
MRRQLLVTALLVAAGCSEGGQETASNVRSYDVAEEPPPPMEPPAPGSREAGTAVQVAMPQIAYTYSYSFRLPSDGVASVQERHLKLCESLGSARCRVVDMSRSSGSGDYVQGALKLQVSSSIARAFGDRLVNAAAEGGGETIDRGISAEDLSKQIVDTAARIRTKEALVERLTALLQTRSGNIEQAVEAERAINAAQEELEKARAWLLEMRGRVAMSTFDIGYTSAAPLAGGVSDPLRDAMGSVGDMFGRSLALIITLIATLLPWALLGLLAWGVIFLIRRRIGTESPNQQVEESLPVSENPAA